MFAKTAILSFTRYLSIFIANKDAELYYIQLMNFPAVTQPL